MIKCLSRGSSIYLPPELVTLENLEERSRRDVSQYIYIYICISF